MSAEVMVRQQSRSRSIVYCAAAIACMAVTAWVTVPIGPVPLSLSPLAIFFTLFALKPRDAFIAICGYVALGAIGLPVFTGFRGGIGALFGPTGGFIMGFVVGACIVLPLSHLLSKRTAFASDQRATFLGGQVKRGFLLRSLIVGVCFAAIYYVFGWLWLMWVGQLSDRSFEDAACGISRTSSWSSAEQALDSDLHEEQMKEKASVAFGVVADVDDAVCARARRAKEKDRNESFSALLLHKAR